MCLIAFAWRAHPAHELLLAANRDEFHARPTAAAAFWPDNPQIFGGRDLLQGGSWLAVSGQRRLACVTNVRRMAPVSVEAPSRGQLVGDFLRGTESAHAFASRLQEQAGRYAGFNLLLWDGDALVYVTNHPGFHAEAVTPGLHALANASLDTPWPKTRRVQSALTAWLNDVQLEQPEMLAALGDRNAAPDGELPDTGIGKDWERRLSPPFIISPEYGTRATTLVIVGSDRAEVLERRYDAAGAESGTSHAQLALV